MLSSHSVRTTFGEFLDHKGNEIVPFGKYDWIDGFDQGLARVRTTGNPGRVPTRLPSLL